MHPLPRVHDYLCSNISRQQDTQFDRYTLAILSSPDLQSDPVSRAVFLLLRVFERVQHGICGYVEHCQMRGRKLYRFDTVHDERQSELSSHRRVHSRREKHQLIRTDIHRLHVT